MNIKIKIYRLNSTTIKIFVAGKLNALTAARFRRDIEKIPQGTKIIFDFSEMIFISSAGLREILICRKKFPDMRIENMNREIHMIFLMTGFEEFIPVALAEKNVTKNFSAEDTPDVSFKKFLRDKAVYSGEEVALVAAGEEYTWQDIEHSSKVIANELHKSGVQQGGRVAVCGSTSINFLLAFFAVQKLGAVAVLLDCKLDAKKIAAQINAALVTHFCYGEIPAAANEKIFLYELQKYSGGKIQTFYSVRDDLNFKNRFAGKSKFHPYVRAEDPAVMIFSSGTDGEIFSARDIFKGDKFREIFGASAKIFGR